MFEVFSGIASAWREVAHISEITGLSIGVLAGLAALIYFDPLARKLAIRTAAGVVIGYGIFVFSYHLGASDKQAQWDAANTRAAAEAAARDASIEKKLETEFPPPPASDQVNPDEAKILADLSAAAAG